MTKYELEKTLSMLKIVRAICFEHMPEMYVRNISREIIKQIEIVEKEVVNAKINEVIE